MARPEGLDIICCSLEPWDEVWRRNQHLASRDAASYGRPCVCSSPSRPSTWPGRWQGRWPPPSALRPIGDSGRLWAMAPRKWLPRRIWPAGDRSLFRQVIAAGRRLGFDRPVLWINDSMYAPMLESTGWPSVYDVTDDWLLGADPVTRDGAAAAERCARCCAMPPRSWCARRRWWRAGDVTGWSIWFRTAWTSTTCGRRPSRPPDLPAGRIVLYQGTLSDGRLDIDLCVCDLRPAMRAPATLVLRGPEQPDPGIDQGPDRCRCRRPRSAVRTPTCPPTFSTPTCWWCPIRSPPSPRASIRSRPVSS